MEIPPEVLTAIRAQLRGHESPQEVKRVLVLAGLSAEVIEAVLPLVLPQVPTPPPVPSTMPQVSPPRLLVDWGQHPEIGHQARPHFLVIGSEPYSSQPDVRVTVDRDLDHDSEEAQIFFEQEAMWGFHVPFRMTTNGHDCRPGQYLIDVRVSFPDVAMTGAPRCFRCSIRLKVQAPGSGRTLEIDGDGQSIVNLQGHDLVGFSRVILKGSDRGVINLNQPGTGVAPHKPAASEPLIHEYTLKIDREGDRKLPRISTVITSRFPLEAAMLVFRSGRRVIVLPRRQVKLGRNRDNDIVLRFLPRSEQYDKWSKALSRTHAVLELVDPGLRIQDTSSTGIRFQGKPIAGEATLTAERVGQALSLDLGVTSDVESPMELELQALRVDGPPGTSDELVARTLGEPVPALWRLAKSARIDAVRIRRRSNLPQEEYLLLFREALIRAAQEAPVVSVGGTTVERGAVRLRHIGQSFWIEPMSGPTPVRIDGQIIAPRELVPLSPGMMIAIGDEVIRFDRAEQSGLGS